MSVPKSKRSKSAVDFEMKYFQVADDVDTIAAKRFGASEEVYNLNKLFIDKRCDAIETLSDKLLMHIKIANSIYPSTMAEWDERRVEIGKAIGICYAILTHYQRVLIRLRFEDNRFVEPVKNITCLINSLKAWRKSDNKLKKRLQEE